MLFIFSDRNFVIANAQVDNTPIIFCNDGFCNLSGYSRAEVMQKSCVCEFLQGPNTNRQMVVKLRESLNGNTEKLIQLLLYRKNGKQPIYICRLISRESVCVDRPLSSNEVIRW